MKKIGLILAGFFLLTGFFSLSYGDDVVDLSSLSKPKFVNEQPYRFAMLPRYSPAEINKRMRPLVKYLTRILGRKVKLTLATNFNDHIQKVRSNYVQLAYQNPVIVSKVLDKVNVVATAVKNGNAKFRGIVIVRSDSPYRSLQDLKGKRIAVVSFSSAGGYVSQCLTFKNLLGMSCDKDLQVYEAVQNKQENVILDVYNHKAEAGFIRESALHVADHFIDPSKIKVLAATEWLPNWGFTVHKSLGNAIAKRIQKALLELPPNGEVLKAAKLTGFIEPADYSILADVTN